VHNCILLYICPARFNRPFQAKPQPSLRFGFSQVRFVKEWRELSVSQQGKLAGRPLYPPLRAVSMSLRSLHNAQSMARGVCPDPKVH
jgi:hypothetical protein